MYRNRWTISRPRAAVSSAMTAVCLVLSACHDSGPVTAPRAGPSLDNAPKFWETNAAVYWNETATQLASVQAVDAARLYAYLSLAQLRAAEAAATGNEPHPPVSAAIGGASAGVLAALFPTQVAAIEAALDAQEAADPWPGDKHSDFAAGEALGRSVAAQIMAFAQGDRVGLQDPGTPPAGAGYWIWNGGPIIRGLLGARPFFLSSGDEFRPPPPPAFGSPAFAAALAEVRAVSDGRTAEQLAIAQYWNTNQSGRSNAAMNGIARELIVKYRRNQTDAARILFRANASAFDALIGCFEAKYHYWFIRPPQADPGITLPIGLPPHPSYPSAHSCVSGAMTTALALAFPSERDRLQAVALEASLSRLYAGIHYRFDMEAGLALGAAVANKAAAFDLSAIGN
jgi:hypothetical protein